MTTARRTLAVLAAATLVCAAAPAPALAGRGKVLKFPRFEVPPRSDREVCVFVRLNKKKPMDIGGSLIVNLGGNESFVSHHFLMWAYYGTNLSGFPAPGTIVDGKACLDFGPSDRTQRILVAGSQTPRFLARLPRGLSQRIEPALRKDGTPEAIGLVLNTHWINASDEPQNASVKIKLLPRRGKTKRYVEPLFEVVANGFLDAAPGEIATASWSWAPGGTDLSGGGLGGGKVPTGDACVVQLTAHMHRRGKLFTIDFEGGGANERLFQTTEYADPGQRLFTGEGTNPPPLLVKVGQRLRYECTHDNGVTTDVRMGCEEVEGQTPGRPSSEVFFDCLAGRPTCEPGFAGAAKQCATDGDCCPAGGPCDDPAYPARHFTGRCVPANLVFGFTSNDDMCILPGSYYEANPDAPPGRECDLSLL